MKKKRQMTGTDILYLDIIKPFPPRHLNEFVSGDIEAVGELAKKHGQFILVYWRLHMIAANNPAVVPFLERNAPLYISWVARAARQERAAERIISMLAAESIPSLVIKGSSLAGEIYGDVNSRSSSDIDILVRYEDVETIDCILLQAGLIRQEGRKLEFDLLRIHHVQYFSPVDKIFIEIHWHFAVPCFFSLSFKEIWAGVRRTDDGGYALSPEMNVILLLMHHHSHSFRQFRVLTDLLWALHRYRKDINWQLLYQDIRDCGLSKTTAIVCGQIEELWGDYAAELPLAGFHDAGLADPGRLGRYFRVYPSSTGHLSAMDKIAKRLALDGSRRIFKSFFEALFPPLAALGRSDEKENSVVAYCRYMKYLTGDWLRKK